MAYAQINYSQLQGKTVNGVKPRYSIHDIGCFITAFCNLEQRFGKNIAPDQMDNELAAKNLYIDVDDGVYDDVGWSTICSYDPSISITATGNGAPSGNNSIVKFVYYSSRLGRNTTHFSLVHDVSQGLIVDSWDGQIKSWNVYGGPKAYATYAKSTPQPVNTVQGVDIMNEGDITNMYRALLGRDPDPGGIQTYKGKSWNSVFYAITGSAEYKTRQQNMANDIAALNNKIAELQRQLDSNKRDSDVKITELKKQLTDAQNKPPVVQEVIKEVVKEVPAQVDEKRVVESVFVRFWNSLFKKG